MTQVAVIGIDIGKTSFHLVALDATGVIQWKKKVSRAQLMRQMEALPRCLVGMEACWAPTTWRVSWRPSITTCG